jgi:hypothetical protein
MSIRESHNTPPQKIATSPLKTGQEKKPQEHKDAQGKDRQTNAGGPQSPRK